MPVYQDSKSKRYYIKIFHDKKSYTCRRDYAGNQFKTKKEAEEYEKIFALSIVGVKTTIILEPKTRSRIITVHHLFELWMKHRAEITKLSTQYNDRCAFTRHIKNALPNIDIRDLKQKDFDCWRDYMNSQHVKCRYKNDMLGALVKMFDYADVHLDIRIPFAKRLNRFIDYYYQPEKEKTTYTIEQLKVFLSYVTDFTHYLIYLFLFFTGLRPGEFRALQICDLDKNNNSVLIRKTITSKLGKRQWKLLPPKTQKSIRRIFLPEIVYKPLYDYLDNIHPKPNASNAFLFYSSRSKKDALEPLSERHLKEYTDKISNLAGLPQIDIYEIGRHSYATYASDVPGAEFKTISKSMGHKSITTTSTYYDHSPEKHLKELSEIIDKSAQKVLKGSDKNGHEN